MIDPLSQRSQDFQEGSSDNFKLLGPGRLVVMDDNQVYRNSSGYVTNVHFLKFDLIKPISHLRASRRPKDL